MFNPTVKRVSRFIAKQSVRDAATAALEPLEDRKLLSAAGFGGWGPVGHGHFGGGFGAGGFGGAQGSTLAFSLTPTAVQTGLDALATADSLTDPTSTTLVKLGKANGVETYSVTLDGTGTVSTLTVDQLGNAVTAPMQSTTTWATLDGTGAGSDSAAAAEITAIATALSLTAPVSTDTVNVSTSSTGSATYSIHLAASNTSTSTASVPFGFGQTITVDSAGDPVGNQQLPFSVFSTAIQDGLNKNIPSGATALASTSTQIVDVRTTDGVTTYSTTFTSSGTKTTVTVDAAGALTSLPSTTTTTYSALSSAVKTELQTLATADGVTTAIASNQSVSVLTETNGTVLYSVTLDATKTGSNTYTFDVTVTVDSAGNPTVLPGGGGGFAGPGSGGFGGFGSPGFSGNGCTPGQTTNASGGATTNASSGSTISVPGGSTVTASSVTAGSSSTISTVYALAAKLLAGNSTALGMLSGYFVEFAPASVDSTVQADLLKLATDAQTLATDTRALTKSQQATLKADTKALASAIKAMNSTLTPLESALKSTAKTWASTIKTDEQTIARDRKSKSSSLATAEAQLTSDKSAALDAILGDVAGIESAITTNTGVIAAQAALTTALPGIGADESALTSDVSTLITDLEAQLSA